MAGEKGKKSEMEIGKKGQEARSVCSGMREQGGKLDLDSDNLDSSPYLGLSSLTLAGITLSFSCLTFIRFLLYMRA
jgi:hypothetical protein